MNIETLESRRLMSASLNAAGLLSIVGSAGDDTIKVSLNAANTKVVVNQNGVVQQFDKAKVKKIYATGKAGNDGIILAPNVMAPAVLDAGGGAVDYLQGEYLQGGGGNDVLYGTFNGTYVDTNGGGGNDTIHVGSESTNYGGAGNDTFYLQGEMTVSDGGVGDDRFVMNNYAFQNIKGGAGLDTADFGSHTEDLVIGNRSALDAAGFNIYSGEPGADYSYGTLVADDIEVLKGGKGNDKILGWSAANQLHGNDGNDFLYGGAGKDALFGGNGDDILVTRDGVADFLSGGLGTDKGKIDALDTTTGVEIFLA